MFAYLTIRIPVWLDKICVWPLLLYRRLTFGEPYRRIYLGDGAYTIVDPDIYYEKCRFHWFLSDGRIAYPVRLTRTGPEKTKRSYLYLHREIIRPRKGKLVDHRDNNPLNNLRSNLRPATHSQNMMNRPKKANTVSQYRGVSWCKDSKNWRVTIGYIKKDRTITKHLGCYYDEIEAARAYDVAALKYHRDFARLNFPREDYVKTRAGYKYAGDSRANKKKRPLAAKLCKIYSSILGLFEKYMSV